MHMSAKLKLEQVHVKVRASCPRGPWAEAWLARWGSPPTWVLRRSPSCLSAGASKAQTSSPPTAPTSSGTATLAGSRWTELLDLWSSGTWCWRTAEHTTSPSHRPEHCRSRGASRWMCTVGVCNLVGFTASALRRSVWQMKALFCYIAALFSTSLVM